MTKEFKIAPQYIKSIEDRTVTGIFSVAGNIDMVGDKMWPGAFQTTFSQRMKKTVFLWQHSDEPPVAVIRDLKEITRDELPPEILAEAPDAIGGALVTREYLPTPRGEELLTVIKSGSPLQMSFGYDAIRFDFEDKDGARVRNLREVRLWEVSDVLWGANEATLASKAWMPLDQLLKHIEARLDEWKSGARHNTSDIKALNAIHSAMVDLGASNCMGSKTDEEGDGKDTGKSRAADTISALTFLKWQTDLLELETAV